MLHYIMEHALAKLIITSGITDKATKSLNKLLSALVKLPMARFASDLNKTIPELIEKIAAIKAAHKTKHLSYKNGHRRMNRMESSSYLKRIQTT